MSIEPSLQHGLLHRQLVFRAQQARRRLVHVGRDRLELQVERSDDALRRVAPAGRGSSPPRAGRAPCSGDRSCCAAALRARGGCARAPRAARGSSPRRVRGGCGCCVRDDQRCRRAATTHDEAPRTPHQTSARCLPTDRELPSTPISAPNTAEQREPREKNTVWIKLRLIRRCANHVSTSASSPPSTPFEKSFDEERSSDVRVGRADEPHDRDLSSARQHRHANRRADDDHRDDREREAEHSPATSAMLRRR